MNRVNPKFSVGQLVDCGMGETGIVEKCVDNGDYYSYKVANLPYMRAEEDMRLHVDRGAKLTKQEIASMNGTHGKFNVVYSLLGDKGIWPEIKSDVVSLVTVEHFTRGIRKQTRGYQITIEKFGYGLTYEDRHVEEDGSMIMEEHLVEIFRLL